MSRKSRVQQIMNEYYSKLGSGPYYYDHSAVAAALRELVNQLQYQSFHHTEEFYQLNADDILTLCNELEKL